MSPGVIEAFETIQIQVTHHDQTIFPFAPEDGLAQAVEHQCAVGKAGQGVVIGEEVDLFRRANLVGDVTQDGIEAVLRSIVGAGLLHAGFKPAFDATHRILVPAAVGASAVIILEQGLTDLT